MAKMESTCEVFKRSWRNRKVLFPQVLPTCACLSPKHRNRGPRELPASTQTGLWQAAPSPSLDMACDLGQVLTEPPARSRAWACKALASEVLLGLYCEDTAEPTAWSPGQG